MILTMDGYIRMSLLNHSVFEEFREWLQSEGLDDERIVEASFEDGYIEARCLHKLHHVGDHEYKRRRFRLRTPPPSSIFEYLE